ncbi:biotin/lipoyl-binding protein [Marivivens donghaensis]|uniref:biotin/lipoyl-binding protein n=1 Tax=Marivivens donghaensis TaxID=1699413 RepID=UPI001C37BB22|nr:biotin/lipoyl-binding protein [Marivivens donghaensis]
MGRFIEETEDAYLQADIVSVSALVEGTVQELPVSDNAQVSAGDVRPPTRRGSNLRRQPSVLPALIWTTPQSLRRVTVSRAISVSRSVNTSVPAGAS